MSDAAATGVAAKAVEAARDDDPSGTERGMLPKAIWERDLVARWADGRRATHTARREFAYRCDVLSNASNEKREK